ncbi:MAG: tyrosine-type recombinase/integrase [Opitutales bacterium]|nr:tyrosine-type recombinase/integrase [Opitutales bacterium]
MDKEIISALELLKGTGVSVLDACRLVRNILDSKNSEFNLSNVQYCAKVISVGMRNVRSAEMSFAEGFDLYYKTKSHLRPDSLRDIRTIGKRLIRTNPDFAKLNFSDLTRNICEDWLNSAFTTPSQFNKARMMLHGLFQFAFRKEWCDKNPIKLIERKKVIEKEIVPLTLEQIKTLLKNAKKYKGCLAPVGLLIFAGIRPREAKRLNWNDIDLDENSITIRSICSKTGGTRHVEVCPNLKHILTETDKSGQKICPKNWDNKWRGIRNNSGFYGHWQQDVLRHTYASYHAKYYRNLPQLQLNMGHHDLSLLRTRYINMGNISIYSAKAFFIYN